MKPKRIFSIALVICCLAVNFSFAQDKFSKEKDKILEQKPPSCARITSSATLRPIKNATEKREICASKSPTAKTRQNEAAASAKNSKP